MRIAVSVDMEGASQLRHVREIFGCFPEYWATGRPRLEADVAAACEGLLAGGADELVVMDNHGGNRINVGAESLPAGARLEVWNAFELRSHGVDATFQVGYHARGGVDGFLSHTYVPGLRLRLDDELISESHLKAWAVGAPLLGIVGNDRHLETLGSLAGTPYLVVQHSHGRGEVDARLRESERRPRRDPGLWRALCPRRRDGPDIRHAGWSDARGQPAQRGCGRRDDGRRRLDAGRRRRVRRRARDLGVGPRAPRRSDGCGARALRPYWLGSFDTAEDAAAADQERVAVAGRLFDAWGAEAQPQWYDEAGDPLPAGFRRA